MAQKGDKITDRDLAAGYLNRIVDHRALLTITLPGVPTFYNSAILEVNPEQGYLLLDELNPKEGHDHLLQIKRLNAKAMIKGVDISFTSNLKKISTEAGIAIYHVSFPDVVWHHQLRQNFRITIEPGMHIPVYFILESGKKVQAELIDISETGIRVYLETYMELEANTKIPSCQIHLPDKTIITSEFEIRFKKYNKKDNTLTIGGRFLELAKTDQKLLARKVSEIQRDMIKRLPKDQL